MALIYVNDKTTRLFKSSDGTDKELILIYGDEVDTLGAEDNGRIPVQFRNRNGWINKEELGNKPVLELYFIDVGQGDSTFVVTPNRKKILIDGGRNDRALRFLSWKYRLEEVEQSQPILIDLVVLTHADADHINGLIPVIASPKLRIKRIIHNGLAIHRKGVFEEKLGDVAVHDGLKYIETSHDTLDELTDTGLIKKFKDWKDRIIEKGDVDYRSVDSSTGRIDLGDPVINLEVVGPHITRVPANSNNKLYQWLGDHAHTINGHSVVIRLTYNKIKILFAGDLNIEGSKKLLSNQEIVDRLDAHVFKAPHHGSHEFYSPMLEAVNPQISVISSGDDVDHGHPRANFLGAIGSVSRDEPLVFSTEIAGNFIEVDEKLEKVNLTKEEKHNMTDVTLRKLRKLFKRRLHGMINVRTDGNIMFAARRVASSYMWESYGDVAPSPRTA